MCEVPRVRVLKCDHARNRNLCSAAMWTLCILHVPFLKIHESNKMQSSVSWKKQHGNDSCGAMWNKGDRWNWWPLNKHRWELMFPDSNMRTRQGSREIMHLGNPSNYSGFYLAGSRPSCPSPSLTSLPQHFPSPFHSHFSAQKTKNAGTHCHSRLLLPPSHTSDTKEKRSCS